MNKKQFLWFLLAIAIFVGAGWFGVRSAVSARKQMAAYSQQAAESLAASLTGAKEPAFSFPAGAYVARVDVEGTIASGNSGISLTSGGGYDHDTLLDYVDALIADENNVGMLLYVDSPGGEMGAADELYLKLMDYKAAGRPIWCYFDSTACSGGYYVAMASDEIQANRNCMCVNIGVYIATYNLSGLFEKLGVEQIAFKSSENKGIGMTGIPWTEEQKEIYQSIVDEDYDLFLEIVAQGRGMTKDEVKARDDGREMTARQALAAGFIDGICRYQEFQDSVLEKAGTDTLYQLPEAQESLSSLLRYFLSQMPQSDTQALTRFAETHGGIVVMAYAG
ncbi:MAG: signal peptide peptidase SppA [Oscillospiraceae bacterium]|nr:signal peptide peptidase SppA [Oscillospiraceae bacterium]